MVKLAGFNWQFSIKGESQEMSKMRIAIMISIMQLGFNVATTHGEKRHKRHFLSLENAFAVQHKKGMIQSDNVHI